MRKKVLTIMFVGISAVLAIVASNRMSVNAIISENVEALSWADGDDDDYTKTQLGAKPDTNGNWHGPRDTDSSNMRDGLPKCKGEFVMCYQQKKEACWY